MKKALAILLLCAIMSVSFVSCSGSLEKQIVGSWKYEFTLNDYYPLYELYGQDNGGEFDGSLAFVPANLIFDFNDDGTLKVSLDEDSVRKELRGFIQETIDFKVETLALNSGESAKEYRDRYKQENGISIDDAMAAKYDADLNLDKALTEFSFDGYYRLNGNKLLISYGSNNFYADNGLTIKISGKKLTFVDSTSTSLDLPFDYPMELVKQK